MRRYGFVLAWCLALAAPASAQSADRCTHDSLTIDGVPIAATLCVTSAANPVAVTITYVHGATTTARTVSVDSVAGAQVSRAVDDLPLASFGIAKKLHVTIAYRAGTAAIEHALLLPGAVVVR